MPLAGRGLRRPDLTIATIDHNVLTGGLDRPIADPVATQRMEYHPLLRGDRVSCEGAGDPRQCIVYVIDPAQGMTQSGMTIVFGGSPTYTHGAFGIGTSEVEHVLATRTLRRVRPGMMALTVDGAQFTVVTANDVTLSIIACSGTGAESARSSSTADRRVDRSLQEVA